MAARLSPKLRYTPAMCGSERRTVSVTHAGDHNRFLRVSVPKGESENKIESLTRAPRTLRECPDGITAGPALKAGLREELLTSAVLMRG